MTNPFARPDQPDSDETIPLVPDSGYADQPSPWSSGYDNPSGYDNASGYESTTVDPLTSDTAAATGGYSNPVASDYSNPAPALPPTAPISSYLPPVAPAPAPAAYPSAAPSPYPTAPAPYPTAASYEQPPTAYGVAPFEPARDGSTAPVVPAYNYGYGYGPQQIDHPNAVPALVLGVLGFFFGVTFPIAWFIGAKGNADIKRNPQRYRPSPMMTIGMVLGIVGTVLMGLFVLLMVVIVLFAIAASA